VDAGLNRQNKVYIYYRLVVNLFLISLPTVFSATQEQKIADVDSHCDSD
jgi:hypothetical protein